MAKVILNHVAKIYPGNVLAVKDFTLEVPDKEFTVFVGPSGCGKSTVLRMIAGLEEITEGEVSIGEKIVNNVPPKLRDIAMVFQNYALYPHMSVFDNMGFGLKLRKYPKKEIKKRVDSAASALGLTEYLYRKPGALSGGQRQRVAVGRAIVRNPAVFLFDEPLSNLDAKMRVQMRFELLNLHVQLKATMIYVTHDQVEAMTLGNRIVVMKSGLIMQAAKPLVVYNNPANLFVARFIGTPPMNIFRGKLVAEDNKLIFDGDSFRVVLPEKTAEKVKGEVNKKAFLGIRPEHLVFGDKADDQFSFFADPVLTENLGNETIVHLMTGTHKFQVRVASHKLPSVNGVLVVRPEMDHIHIFDGEFGRNLTVPDEVVGSKHSGDLKAEELMDEDSEES